MSMSPIFLIKNSPNLCANHFCKLNFTIYFIRYNFFGHEFAWILAKNYVSQKAILKWISNPYFDPNWWYVLKMESCYCTWRGDRVKCPKNCPHGLWMPPPKSHWTVNKDKYVTWLPRPSWSTTRPGYLAVLDRRWPVQLLSCPAYTNRCSTVTKH